MSSLAFSLYLLFITSWFLHLTARLHVLGLIRFDMLLVVIIGALSFVNRPKGRGQVPRLLAALLIYVVLTIPFVEWPGSVVKSGLESLIKALVFYFFTTALVTTERRLRLTVAVFVLCQVFRIAEPVYLHETEGYWGSQAMMSDWEFMDRLSGSPYDVVNPNGLAFVILTALCFMHFVWPLTKVGLLAYLCVLPVAIYALVLTGSRSGMVGIATAFVAIWLKSRHKISLLAVAAVGIAVVIPTLNDSMADRYLSIVSTDTRNAGTVEFRKEGIQRDLEVALRRPLFGHGLGTSREANANFGENDQPSHNLYTEVLQELGLFGLILFLMIIAASIKNLRVVLSRVRASTDAGPYLPALTNALGVWAAVSVMFSLVSYGLTNYGWYFIAGLSQVVLTLSDRTATVPERIRSGQPLGQRGGDPAPAATVWPSRAGADAQTGRVGVHETARFRIAAEPGQRVPGA